MDLVTSSRIKNAEKELKEVKDFSNLASVPKRLAARLIDILVVTIVIGFPLLKFGGESQDDSVRNAVFLILFWTYFLFSDGIFGQGVGKRLMKIKVVKFGTNKSCSFGQSFWRNLSGILVVDWFFALGQKQMRLGDMIANTQVINAK